MGKSPSSSRNDGFSRDAVIEDELGGANIKTILGENLKYVLKTFTTNPITGHSLLDSKPKDSDMDELRKHAVELSESIEDARNSEGNVYINGRLVPGIFQGFEVRGGVVTERFDRQRLREGLMDPIKAQDLTADEKKLRGDQRLFQIDKGIKPFSGSASWILLDDDYSTALKKAYEFCALMTYYTDNNEEYVQKQFKRVYNIDSFLIGEGRPFNAKTIKILEYSITMDNSIEGALRASFSFEQFMLSNGEAKIRPPATGVDVNYTGSAVQELSTDENPFTAEPISVS